MATTNNFIIRKDGYVYNTILGNSQDVEQSLVDFSAVLEDFPAPTFKWLDQRGDDNLNGPGAWECEIQNDQSTTFTFVLPRLDNDDLEIFMAELIECLHDVRMNQLDPDAMFYANFKFTLEFVAGSMTNVNKLHVGVFWEVHY